MNNKKIFIGIVGSRGFEDYEKLKNTIDQYVSNHLKNGGIIIVSSGSAIRADKLADRYAEERGLSIIFHKPDWKKYGKDATLKRNELIVRDSDIVFVCWKRNARGSKHTIDLCKKMNKHVEIIGDNQERK